VTEYLSSGEIGHGYSISLAKQQKKIDVALQLSEWKQGTVVHCLSC